MVPLIAFTFYFCCYPLVRVDLQLRDWWAQGTSHMQKIGRTVTAGSYWAVLVVMALYCLTGFYGCSRTGANAQLTRNVHLELVDWHITGLWIINCPVAWVKVTNRNEVSIKDVTFQYNTYDFEGHPLDEDTFTIEGEVPPGTTKNFIELYLGLVHLHSDKLSVTLLSVAPG